MEFPELQKQLISQADLWKPHVILVEDKASGQSLLQQLQTATRYAVAPIKIDHDKQTRAAAVTPMFEAGKVFFPESCPLLQEYQDELATFPAGAHDDMVDSTVQALNYLRARCPIDEPEPSVQVQPLAARPEDRLFMATHQRWTKKWDRDLHQGNGNTWFE